MLVPMRDLIKEDENDGNGDEWGCEWGAEWIDNRELIGR